MDESRVLKFLFRLGFVSALAAASLMVYMSITFPLPWIARILFFLIGIGIAVLGFVVLRLPAD